MKRATYGEMAQEDMLFISIHALVKRATRITAMLKDARDISIHALVKRATTSRKVITVRIIYFNPRPREEGDAAEL